MVTHRIWDLRIAAVALAGLALAQVPAMAAPKLTAAPAYGRWSEKNVSNLDFDIRPAAKADQLVLVIPAEVTFPGSHEFVLIKRPDGAFEAAELGRPKVSLTFQSAAKAKLQVRGKGSTAQGSWVSMNDYTLVRR